MENKDNITKKSVNEEYIRRLTEAAETIAECGEDVQNAAEEIILACYTPGTKAEANKDILLAKVDDMKRLYVLLNMASKRLLDSAKDLRESKLKEDTFKNMPVYGQFLVDQLKSEEEGSLLLLKKLSEGCG